MPQSHHLLYVAAMHTNKSQKTAQTTPNLLQKFPIVRQGHAGGTANKPTNADQMWLPLSAPQSPFVDLHETVELCSNPANAKIECWPHVFQRLTSTPFYNNMDVIHPNSAIQPPAMSSEQWLAPGSMDKKEMNVEEEDGEEEAAMAVAKAAICAVPMLPPVHSRSVCVEHAHTQTSPPLSLPTQTQQQAPLPLASAAAPAIRGGCRRSRNLRRSTSQLLKNVKRKVGELRRSVSREGKTLRRRHRSHSHDSRTHATVPNGVASSLTPSLASSSLSRPSSPSTDSKWSAHENGAVELEFVEPCVDGSYLIQFRRTDASTPLGIFFTFDKEEADGGVGKLCISRLAGAPHLVACSEQLRVGDRVLAIQGVPAQLLKFEAITDLVRGSLLVTINVTHI